LARVSTRRLCLLCNTVVLGLLRCGRKLARRRCFWCMRGRGGPDLFVSTLGLSSSSTPGRRGLGRSTSRRLACWMCLTGLCEGGMRESNRRGEEDRRPSLLTVRRVCRRVNARIQAVLLAPLVRRARARAGRAGGNEIACSATGHCAPILTRGNALAGLGGPGWAGAGRCVR
jgi:hypothetical protein